MPKMDTGAGAPTDPHPGPVPRRAHGPFVTLLDCECIRESEKAILCFTDPNLPPTWFPKSQISDNSEVYKDGTSGKLIVTRWIYDQKFGSEQEPAPTPPIEPPAVVLTDSYRLYRQLVRKYHPDVNHAEYATEVMADLTTLWQTVLGEAKR